MKIKKIALIIAASLFVSCANKTPRAVIVPIVAPKVENAQKQAKVTSEKADNTITTIQTIKEKYKATSEVKKDIEIIEESAKATAIEAKKTEFQLEFLKEYAKDVDIKAAELTKDSEKKDEVIYTKQKELQKVQIDIIQEKAKVAKKNGYLLAAGSIIIILASLIIKPWKFFI